MTSPHSTLRGTTLVAVGSTNPVKLAAVRAVMGPLVPEARVEAVAVESGVAEQPWGDEETIHGATTRARLALTTIGADLGVGLEGGVVESREGSLRTCAWAAVVSADGAVGIGGSLAMQLPPEVSRLVREGVELGAAMDILTGEHNTKVRQGAVGILTGGLVSRQRAYELLVTYALARFLSPEHW